MPFSLMSPPRHAHAVHHSHASHPQKTSTTHKSPIAKLAALAERAGVVGFSESDDLPDAGTGPCDVSCDM